MRSAALLCLAVGVMCLLLAAVSFVLWRNVFDSAGFGRRAAESLSHPGVSRYAANLVASRVIQRKPDLIAFRPMIVSASEMVVMSKAFRSVLERAAVRAHELAFSEESQRVILSLPDLSVLVHDAISSGSPAIASKVPKSLDYTVEALATGRTAALVPRIARAGEAIRWLWAALFVLAVAFLALGHWFALDRRRGMGIAGATIAVTGLALIGLTAANPLAGLWIRDPALLGLVRGLWRVYLGDLARLGLLIVGIGILMAAGASSLLERMDPFERISTMAARFGRPPETRTGRLLWGFGVFACGCAIFAYPVLALSAAALVVGVSVAYIGARELFRVFVETVEASDPAANRVRSGVRPRRVATAAISILVVALGGIWAVWRKPPAIPTVAASEKLACNGYPELCDRRIDQVVFPGAHNAMSNQDAPGWMFPHHEAGFAQMLRDGVRALLIDVHYGFAGGARIKTDMSAEPNAEKISSAVGNEAYEAAKRIRDRLIGVNESRHESYFCHGFCELGAYPVAPALRDIRDFAVAHPDEVLILVIEDYVTPDDLAAEFEKAGLVEMIHKDKAGPPWPTLRQLVDSGQRILVFIESGKPGVTWLRPAFETFRETPYTFHKVEDFSCRANRGGDSGSLFQINHWIDTTPAPTPSNAAVVNEYSFLLARAKKCASRRRHIPNIIAVDFYKTGDLLAVVNELNGVAERDSPESRSP